MLFAFYVFFFFFFVFFLFFILRLITMRVDNRRHQRQLDPHRWFLCCTWSTCPRTWASSPRGQLSDNLTEICEWRTSHLCGRSRRSPASGSSHLRISSPSPRPPLPYVAPPCPLILVHAFCSCLQWGSPMRCNKSLLSQLRTCRLVDLGNFAFTGDERGGDCYLFSAT